VTTRARWSVVLARAVYRALLWLAPGRVRRAYRDEMIATFEAASADAATRGSMAVLRLLLREARDLASARRSTTPRVHTPEGRLPIASALGEWLRGSAWLQAWRSLRRRPAFLAAAILTLGAGTGLTTAVFSLVDTVLIKPLPYPDSDQLVAVYESSPSLRERTSLISPAHLEDWRRLNRTLTALAGGYFENVTDTSGDTPERLSGTRVTPGYFAVYAMPPIAGRTFVADEEGPNGRDAVVISEGLWMRRYGRDQQTIGRTLNIGGHLYPIVGVMPAVFSAMAMDVWLPARLGDWFPRDGRFINGVGRLKPGVTASAAWSDLTSVQAELAKQFPKTDAGWSAEVLPLKGFRVGNSGRAVMLVFGAVALLWLIALANIAGLMLVQVRRRTMELAVRMALGASRMRVIATVAREGVIISAVGAVIGGALATWLVSIMRVTLVRRPRVSELAIDWRSLSFIAVTSVLAAAVCGLLPAVAATRSGLARAIAAQGRGVAGARHLLQKSLVVGQLALSVVLVGAATLLFQSYYALTHVDTGFKSDGAIAFHVGARWDEDRTQIGQLQQTLLTRLAALPHVQAAGFVNFLPATGASLRYQVRGEGLTATDATGAINVGARMMGGNYLHAIGASIVAGTGCPDLVIGFDKPRYALVNKRLVELHGAGQNLVGHRLTVTWSSGAVNYTIVGVVDDLAEDGQSVGPFPYVYNCDPAGSWPDPEYVVRTSNPNGLMTDVRRVVHELDSTRAIFGVRAIADVMDAALDQPRFDASLLGLFAGAAVALAAIGLYSLFMLVVSESTRALAVRLALGASRRQVVQLVMTGAGRLLISGLASGLILTTAVDRLLRGALFGVRPLDPPALAGTAVILAVVSILAVAGPAIRASRTQPMEVLK
jgi:putative ABC transport system permease protein